MIEVKQDLSRFEDTFYDFQTMEFAGLPIIVNSFTPYKMCKTSSLILLCIQPEYSPKITPMYFVVVDINNAKAYQCTQKSAGDPWNLTQVLFITETRFIG